MTGWAPPFPRSSRRTGPYVRGPSRRRLKPLVADVGPVDVFLADALGTFPSASFDFQAGWDGLRSGGCVLRRQRRPKPRVRAVRRTRAAAVLAYCAVRAQARRASASPASPEGSGGALEAVSSQRRARRRRRPRAPHRVGRGARARGSRTAPTARPRRPNASWSSSSMHHRRPVACDQDARHRAEPPPRGPPRRS